MFTKCQCIWRHVNYLRAAKKLVQLLVLVHLVVLVLRASGQKQMNLQLVLVHLVVLLLPASG